MPRRDDVPQTVGEAARAGWEWLRVRCIYCRRSRAHPSRLPACGGASRFAGSACALSALPGP